MAEIAGTAGDDVLNGTEGDDIIHGFGGNDTIIGGAGRDTINGGDGNDNIHGGMGGDTVSDGPGNDFAYGEADQDIFYSSPGDDFYDGGTGFVQDTFEFDQIVYIGASAGIVVDLCLSSGQVRSAGGSDAADVGIDTIVGFELIGGTAFDDVMIAADIGMLFGGAGGDDTLVGGAGQDQLDGGSGNDTLSGNGGVDVLLGLEGDDVLTGGPGTDYLIGGAGADLFVDTAANLNGDTISDYGRGDRIVITDGSAGSNLGRNGSLLSYGPMSLLLNSLHNASIIAMIVPSGGVQIAYGGPALVVSAGPSIQFDFF